MTFCALKWQKVMGNKCRWIQCEHIYYF